MTDEPDRTFRLGDRVQMRIESRKTAHRGWGDVIGVSLTINSEPSEKVCIGWADGSQSFEKPIELRLVAER